MSGAVMVILGNAPATALVPAGVLAGIAAGALCAAAWETVKAVARVARQWREWVPEGGCLRVVDPVRSWPAGDGDAR